MASTEQDVTNEEAAAQRVEDADETKEAKVESEVNDDESSSSSEDETPEELESCLFYNMSGSVFSVLMCIKY
jgi:hypothetical protein